MKNLFIYTTLVCFIGLGFYACDSTTSPQDPLANTPAITSFSISPQSAEFSQEQHGFRDTTITIELQINTQNITEKDEVWYSISTNDGEVMLEEMIESPNSGSPITETFELETNTTSIQGYIINVYVNAASGNGNYAQALFEVNGFSNFPPEILATDSPGEITRPTSGEIPAVFTAKITDLDGQETIENVFIRVINQQSGEVQGSPFEMFDNGTSRGDEVANDSTYTWSLPVTQTDNNPNRDFDIEFFALDKGGLTSDTVRTTFRIRE